MLHILQIKSYVQYRISEIVHRKDTSPFNPWFNL